MYKNNKKQRKRKTFKLKKIKKFIHKIIILAFLIFISFKSIKEKREKSDNIYNTLEIEKKDEKIYKKEKEKFHEEESHENHDSYNNTKYQSTEDEMNKINSYIKDCRNKTLYDKEKLFLSKNPKISMIIPVYNKANDLYYSIRSVQNQKMKQIEIILVNDASTDDTLKAIEKLKEEDPRIKIINNEKNRRILYSKSIGALYANGKYILQLDQDDMFMSDNVFYRLYDEAENNDYDMVQFRDTIVKNFNFEKRLNRYGMIFGSFPKEETQPFIKYSMFKKYNYLLWGLLIKSDIYKKAVIYLWQYIINYKIIHYEDFTITFFISILSQKFKYLNEFYIAHLSNNNSTSSNKVLNYQYSFSVLLFYNFMFEYHVKNHPEDIIIFQNLINGNKKETFFFTKIAPKLYEFVFKKIFDYFSYDQKIDYMSKLKLDMFDIKMKNNYQYFMEDNEYNSILDFQNIINNRTLSYKKPDMMNTKIFISILIYCNCNTSSFLLNTIYSLLNQKNFDNYEVIIIYDNNNKKEYNYINKLIVEYGNMKLINNEKDKGIFYSYYKGILESKGEYILTLKAGYTLSKENILYDIYQNIDDYTDILECNLLINNNEFIKDTSLQLYRCSHFRSKINLDFLKYNQKCKQIDQEKELMVNKIIKSNVYKNIINQYDYIFKDNMINYYYDEIMTFLFEQKNITIKHINTFGIIEYSKIVSHNNDNDNYLYEMNNTKKNENLIHDSIYYIKFLFYYNKDNKEYALNEFYNIMNIIYNKYNIITIEAKDVLDKFLKCEYLGKYDKNLLITYYNALINREKYYELEHII